MTSETPEQRARRLQKRFEQKIVVWEKSDGRCWYCGVALDFDRFHADHVTPSSLGGSNDIDNLAPSCRSCNCSKSDRDLEGYRTKKRRQRDGVPYFSQKAIDWLLDQGFEIDFGEPYLFWFEQRQ